MVSPMPEKQISEKRFQKLQNYVEENGGQLLSGRSTVDGKVKILCARGHEFNPAINNLLRTTNPTWCSHQPCLGERISKRKVDQDRDRLVANLQNVIIKKGGKWVDREYVNNRTHIYIDCGKGHQRVPITPDSLMRGSWCKECDPTKKSKSKLLNELIDIAAERGGELLSDRYENAKSKLWWRCGACGNEWPSTPDSVKSGSWCNSLECNSGITIDDNAYIQRAIEAVTGAGGTFQSIDRRIEAPGKTTVYVKYLCEVGHPCDVRLYTLEKGHGCNTCNLRGVNETVSRAILEHLFECSFTKVKPLWLRSETGHRLELDGYNEHLGLAFEYQGQQHYEYLPFFHKSYDDFKQRKYWDEHKRKVCESQEVKLLEIPYWIQSSAIQEFIYDALDPTHKALVKNKELLDVSRIQTGRGEELARLPKLAQARGGRLISKIYIDSQTPLLWDCSNPLHGSWRAAPSSITQGTWCPRCGDDQASEKRKTPISQIQRLGAVREWTYLGEEAATIPKQYRFKCKNGHEFATDIGRLKKALGCQKCGKLILGRKYALSLASLADAARKEDGYLVSRHYLNARQKLIWRCELGHAWRATANSILHKGSWCPVCTNRAESLTEKEVSDFLDEEKKEFRALNIQHKHALKVQKKILLELGK